MIASLRERLRAGGRRPLPCEVHVPIAPTPVFFLRVRMLAASLRRWSEFDCSVVVTVSRDVEPYDLHAAEPWSRAAGVQWRWMSAEQYAEHGMYGTAMVRFTYDFTTPFVLMLDADVLCTGSLAELPQLAGQGVAGVTAWVTPMLEPPVFRDGRERSGPDLWRDLFAHTGLDDPPLEHEHPSWRIMGGSPEQHRWAPAYFNLGMLAGRAETMRTIGAVALEDMARVDAFVDTRFRCQLGLSISAGRTSTPLVSLPVRYNYPNSRWFWDAHTDDHDVRILHYATTDEVDREALASTADLAPLLARDDLSPPNELLRSRIAALGDALDLDD
ncbi:MAG TPA: hypothetical protein VLK58_27505 [Conexibacter sp.]|nr:hypothetical protein [Conexibacter sp.]